VPTKGRVTESSVKNFQLTCVGSEGVDPDQVVLQFGRVGKNKFNMDLRYPLSPMQVGR
jgi:tubby and related proteins